MIKEVFGRELRMTEVSGLLDPRFALDGSEYSLLRHEGQGLKELVVILANIYHSGWQLLIIDEPELHLHAAASSLLMDELLSECRRSSRNAIIVTHESRFIRPQCAEDLKSIWMFRSGDYPRQVWSSLKEQDQQAVSGDLKGNPRLVADLMFSPRPVLVEGESDVAALSAATSRIFPGPAGSNSEFIRCGGVHGLARWFEVAISLGLPALAIGDLDALFEQSFHRLMDNCETVQTAYIEQWQVKRTSEVLKPVHEAMRKLNVPTDNASRRRWLADLMHDHLDFNNHQLLSKRVKKFSQSGEIQAFGCIQRATSRALWACQINLTQHAIEHSGQSQAQELTK